MRMRGWSLLCVSALLGACVTSTQSGRLQLSVPAPVGAVYSDADMGLQLVLAAPVEGSCDGMVCADDRAFELQVQRLGARLAAAACAAYPRLAGRCERFEFTVAESAQPGSVSNASGAVAIFRGVQYLHLDDEALAFLIAREMGHVIDGHHEENSATGILFSVLARLLLPVANLLRGAAAVIQGDTVATATTTTASLMGAQAVRANKRPEQSREADDIALELLAGQGWSGDEVAAFLNEGLPWLGDDGWSQELRISVSRLERLTQGPPHLAQFAAYAPIPLAAAAGPKVAWLVPFPGLFAEVPPP